MDATKKSYMPFSQLIVLTGTNLAQAVMLTMPFTVAVYMVRAWEPDSGEEVVGRMTGLLAAVYSLSQTTTSFGWGLWSSRYGRKPVMVIGSAASTVCLIWFGLSGSYSGACAARAVAGLLNGIICAWKCIIGESCDALLQGKVMAMMSLAWGLGCVLGPVLGGVFSQPCSSWPNAPLCGDDGLFMQRPYLLPSLLAAAFNAATFLANLLVLEETLPTLSKPNGPQSASHAPDRNLPDLCLQSAQKRAAVQLMAPAAISCGGWGGGRAGAAASAAGLSWLLGKVASGLRPGHSYSRIFRHGDEEEAQVEGAAGSRRAVPPCSPISRFDSAGDLSAGKGAGGLAGGGRPACFLAQASQLQGSCSAGGAVQLGAIRRPSDWQQQQQQQHQHPHLDQQHLGQQQQQQTQQEVVEELLEVDAADSAFGDGRVQRVDSEWLLRAYRRQIVEDREAKQQQEQQQEQQQKQEQQQVGKAVAAPEADADASATISICKSGGCGTWSHRHDAPGQSMDAQRPTRSPLALLSLIKAPAQPNTDKRAGAHDDKRPAGEAGDNAVVRSNGAQGAARSAAYVVSSGGASSLEHAGGSCTEGDEQQALLGGDTLEPPGHRPRAALSGSHHGGPAAGQLHAAASEPPWYCDREVVLAVLGYGAVALLFCMLDEVLPIFASAPVSEGGLDMQESELSVPLAINGFTLIVFSLVGYPQLQRLFGTLRVSRYGLVLAVAVCMAIPLPSLAAAARGVPAALPGVLLSIALAIKAVAQSCTFTGSMILVNTLPRPSQLGAVNGAGQTLASLVRGIGPLSGGVLWGAALHLARGGPFLVFGVAACVALASLGLFCCLEPVAGEQRAAAAEGARHGCEA